MATMTKTAPKAAARVKLDVKAGRYHYYATKTGVAGGSRSPVYPPGEMFGSMLKGEARRLRKALRAAGFAGHAAAPRS